MVDRRSFLKTSVGAVAASQVMAWAERSPIKLAHREGNMLKKASPYCYELGASIPGLSGIEVQTVAANLWDKETVLTYKREANKWRMRTCSMGGTLPATATILKPETSEEGLRKTIHAAEILGASVVLVPGLNETCPVMSDESSYGPPVEMLKRLAPVARDVGVTLGLEMSLGLNDYIKFIQLVGDPNVRAYWDATGTDHMGHPGDGIKGLEVIGKDICQMHLKNGTTLMEERHLLEVHPKHKEAGRTMSIDWPKALGIIKASGYDNWFAFETPHKSPEACVEDTTKNIAFVMKYLS